MACWKSSEVMKRAYSKVRSEEAVPEISAAAARGAERMEMGEFPKELEAEPT